MKSNSQNALYSEYEDISNISFAKDVVSSLGCLIRKKENVTSEDSFHHSPFALLPSPFSRRCFEEAVSIQTDIQLLLHKVAHDHLFLQECLESVIKVDGYIKGLWNIYDTVYREGYQQNICLAMTRSDYMLHTSGTTIIENRYDKIIADVSLKQVEINTISASSGGIAQRLQIYHSIMAGQKFGPQAIKNIPTNTSCDILAEGLITAWSLYDKERAIILFLTYDVERHMYDQRHLETTILKLKPEVKILRRSMKYLQDHLVMDDDRKLWVDGLEIAVVYQRSLYSPSDFRDEASWRCRLTMERSKAILCPNAGYHLAGTKKVQQVLSEPGVLERFIENVETRERIKRTFMRMFGLEKNIEADRVIEEAIREADKYVLKPQREGGGNNIYGEDLAKKLNEIKETDERLSFILMERINPMVIKNLPILANSEVDKEPSLMVSELGVYGVLVGTGDNVVLNRQAGYLLKTKKLGTNEGGVSTGYAVFDTPFLVD